MSGENMHNATAMHHGPDACTHTSGRRIPVEEFVERGKAAQAAVNEVLFYTRLKDNLKRWASRYAQAEHAKKHVAETRLLMQEIDERILALNRD